MIRRTEVWRDGAWLEVRFEDLKKGDMFRLFDPPEWTPVRWYIGGAWGDQVEFVTESDPYQVPSEHGSHLSWAVDCAPKE